MEYLVISLTAIVVAALTFFSGFGLGTLLMPAFAIFFPVELAVAATAVVHLANNVFKAALIGRKANLGVVVRFAIPAAIFAIPGALLLGYMSGLKPIFEYDLASRHCSVTGVKIVIASLIFAFALLELKPGLIKLKLDSRYIPLGGALSGFFGGISGHQGALRTIFLIKLGMTKEVFIGTVVLSAVIVDISRITVYGITFMPRDLGSSGASGIAGLILCGIIAAFTGSFIGSRILKKLTMHSIQITVGIMLILLAFGLSLGII